MGKPGGGGFGVLFEEGAAGVEEGAIAGVFIGDGGGPFNADGGVIVNDASGVAVGGGVFFGTGEGGNLMGGGFGILAGPVGEGGANSPIFAVSLSKRLSPREGFFGIIFGDFFGDLGGGFSFKGASGDVLSPFFCGFEIAVLEDGSGGDVDHFSGIFVTVGVADRGEFGGEIRICIGEAEDGAPLHVIATVLHFRGEAVEVGEGVVGVGAGPSSEGGGHVALGGVGSVEDGFLPGESSPGVVEFAELGGVLGEVVNLFAHEFGVFRGHAFEEFGEGEAAGDGAFGGAEFFAKEGDVFV